MKTKRGEKRTGTGAKRAFGIGGAGLLAGAMTIAPLAAAGNARESDRITNEHNIDRAEVANLQRWVALGHADWCKDARLVAAEELRRLAPDYSGGALELNPIDTESTGDGLNRVTFEWAPIGGRTLYRVTVERFEWLLPIAKNVQSIVWVPTSTEILVHE
jgi:hypothetical protein